MRASYKHAKELTRERQRGDIRPDRFGGRGAFGDLRSTRIPFEGGGWGPPPCTLRLSRFEQLPVQGHYKFQHCDSRGWDCYRGSVPRRTGFSIVAPPSRSPEDDEEDERMRREKELERQEDGSSETTGGTPAGDTLQGRQGQRPGGAGTAGATTSSATSSTASTPRHHRRSQTLSTWERHVETGTQRTWYRNKGTEEVFFADDEDSGWASFEDETGRAWWWHQASERFFFEPKFAEEEREEAEREEAEANKAASKTAEKASSKAKRHQKPGTGATSATASSATPSAGSTPRVDKLEEPEVWERYVEPRTERTWYWNTATEEVFYADDETSGWASFEDGEGQLWWWHEGSKRFFYEPVSEDEDAEIADEEAPKES